MEQKKDLSLRPVATHLSELLNTKVVFVEDTENAQPVLAELPPASVCLLENLRFTKREEKNDPEFARILASYDDAYINDAFGTCHVLLPKKGRHWGDLSGIRRQAQGQPFTLSFRAFAIVILTTLSAGFWICSPVDGLRTIRSGRSRQ